MKNQLNNTISHFKNLRNNYNLNTNSLEKDQYKNDT